jgi:hypothetical protein
MYITQEIYLNSMNQKQFEYYISKLCINLPREFKKIKSKDIPIHIDVIFEGGLFNGGYLLGVALFLKYLEKKSYIIVDRISGTSIGAIIGLLYLSDKLDLAIEIYPEIYDHFKNKTDIRNFDAIMDLIKTHTCEIFFKKSFKELFRRRLFITYHDTKTCRQIVRSCYKNMDDIIESIKKSTFIPFITYNSHLYKGRYIDGLYPYIFVPSYGTEAKKILYVNIHALDKYRDMFSVKNEKTNIHRIFSGILDFHLFLIKQRKTSMCSYVNDWSIYDKCNSGIFLLFCRAIFYIICMLYFIYYLIHKILGRFIKKNDSTQIIDHFLQIICIVQKNILRFVNN